MQTFTMAAITTTMATTSRYVGDVAFLPTCLEDNCL